MSQTSADELVARAEFAERSGRREEAVALWAELVAAHPDNPRALYLRARKQSREGDAAGALTLLAQAETQDRTRVEFPLLAASCHRALGAPMEALAAIERALAIHPYSLAGLLRKGEILESIGKPRLAAGVFRNALKIAPPEERLSPDTRAALQHAREVVIENARALATHLRDATSQARDAHASEHLERFDECLDILAGVRPRFVQDPIQLCYPRLPAIPFFDREHFPWLPRLEEATRAIQKELDIALQDGRAELTPYIQYPPGAPVNQWVELNHSPAWSTYFLWRDGEKQPANCERCPETTALLESLPMTQMPGYAPTAMFSVLAPRTHIPAHTGSTNTRLIVHLPLVLPPSCRFRVGNDVREWRMGEAWVFDDTIEHEAWNDSDQTRVVLIFDVWNPLLSAAECELVAQMMSALSAYNAAER